METKTVGQFIISDPIDSDATALGPMHLQCWHESYINPELGITDLIINDTVSFLITDEAVGFRTNTITQSHQTPDQVLYRVVKSTEGSIVGFLHGSKNDFANELEGIYLLSVAKGLGVGSALMHEFLAWSDPTKPCHLEVIAYNERALDFYKKFGFQKTDKEIEMFKGHFPVVEMLRPC